jgi:hypothetical protein
MPITYTNRKGFTYTLCRGTTKTGKPRYYFAREPKDEPVEQLPEGYTISESVNGVVSLSKAQPLQLHEDEINAVKRVVAQHPKSHKYRVNVRPKRIEIYESVGPDAEALIADFGQLLPILPGTTHRLAADLARHAQFTPVLRFTLIDEARAPLKPRACAIWAASTILSTSATAH